MLINQVNLTVCRNGRNTACNNLNQEEACAAVESRRGLHTFVSLQTEHANLQFRLILNTNDSLCQGPILSDLILLDIPHKELLVF